MNNTTVGRVKQMIEELISLENNTNHSGITDLLQKEEELALYRKLLNRDSSESSDTDLVDLEVKTKSINTLLVLLNNKPELQHAIDNQEEDSSLLKLHRIAYELNLIFYEKNQHNDDSLQYLVLATINAVLADRYTEMAPRLNHILDNILVPKNNIETTAVKDMLYFITLNFFKLIKTQYDKQSLFNLIDHTKGRVTQLQQKNHGVDIKESYYLVAMSNIFYSIEQCIHYLFSGKADDDEDIFSLLDSHFYNALELLHSSPDKDLYNTINLLKFALEKFCKSSVWSVASKSPTIKRFFEKRLESTNDILYTLLPSQRDTLLEMLTMYKSIIVSMPTSAGKSLLAELHIIFTLQNFEQEEEKPTICYLVPTNALINQVKRKLESTFAPLGYTVDKALPIHDIDSLEEQALLRTHIHVLVTTPEKFDILIRKDHNAIKNLKLIVLDEAHNVADKGRGSKFEMVLSTVKQKKNDARFVLLSPFIEKETSDKIAKWLGDSDQDSISISYEWSPTKQFLGSTLFKQNKTKNIVRYLPTTRNTLLSKPVDIGLDKNLVTIKNDYESIGDTDISLLITIERYLSLGSILVLCKGPGTTENIAKQTLKYMIEEANLQKVGNSEKISTLIAILREEVGEDEPLIELLPYGIAYHHSGLSSFVKQKIEELIKEDVIRIIFATTTLAQGVNFPITTVIFRDTIVGSGATAKELSANEFWNIAGRAGRAFKDSEGHILTIQKSSYSARKTISKLTTYLQHDFEEITSSLKAFFNEFNENTILNLRLIENNSGISNFLQYLNHLMNISYDYNFDKVDLSKLRNILSKSLVYSELTFEQGFMEAQSKITEFSNKYIEHLSSQNIGSLKLADAFGISDFSLRKVQFLVNQLKSDLISKYGETSFKDHFLASELILKHVNEEEFSKVVEVISNIPEMKIHLQGDGEFDPESISKIVVGWVNGKSIKDIATDIRRDGQTLHQVTRMCNKYINGRMQSYMPWGVSLYQQLANDQEKHLPTYIYFGVKDPESVVLSMVGIPRFVVNQVKDRYIEKYSVESLNPRRLDQIKEELKSLDYSSISTDGIDTTQLSDMIIDSIS